MLKKRITLKDIARETGVHVSTVSRALDPVERKNITEEVANRIQAAANTLGYRPNRIAAGLRTNRTMTVGVMIPDITNVIFPPILRGIECVLEPFGYASIIVNTDSDAEREERLIDVLRDRGVDGIIHAAVLRSDPAIAKAAQDGLPVVTLNRKVDGSPIPSVVNDEDSGICQMLRHLRSLGHTRIAHIAGPQDLSTGQLRLTAFRRAAEDMNINVADDLIAVAARFDEAEGARCLATLLTTGRPFTAVLCANDRLALGAIEAMRERNIACPEQISVTGFNDMPFLNLIQPKLTTIRIQQFGAGKAAANILLRLLNSDDKAMIPVATVLPVELIVRDSTARTANGA
ncbi:MULTISPECIES: LacI family DNA-binding transcriptional regulator [Rhizobium]|uniref:HTH-type transcriptional regulator regA n=1 Tax=Rhizobium favelukesii TaxID=348824 RepID=W6RIG8_9HYPH|nr:MULTISPECIES: LacI family DNA-binding transcriptional regulator [Rhizobium]MCA0806889.1 LacI family transcriptional regulator [Rhizobium sp. T1473]MCS0460701.1 LacI family transcriptional regulator [Rhizobium favelukesii]UFS85639.1 LacI family transcriptional regulator [Rhizobium sp. T136]CDM60972.1 HTH-type transcriptional regulator regA [Rhizobium favelukesii]